MLEPWRVPGGRACQRVGGGVLVAFFELEAQVDGLLLEVGDLLGEGVDVGGDAEPGLVPGLLAECLGQVYRWYV